MTQIGEHKMAKHRIEFYKWRNGQLIKTEIAVRNEVEALNIAHGSHSEDVRVKVFNELEKLILTLGFELEDGCYA